MDEKMILAVVLAAFLGYKYGQKKTAATAATAAAPENEFNAGGLDWLLNWDRPA
jgi:hypothetical protein